MSIKFSAIPQKRLLAGITSASSSFYLNNILGFDGINDVVAGDLGTQHYVCFRNDTGSIVEFMEIDPATIGTGPVTILRRGLSFYGDRTTETTALKLDWAANSIVMLGTDVPQIFQYLKEYIDAASIAGAVPASTSAAGIVVEGSQAEVDAGTITKTILSVAYKLFAPLDKIRAKKYHDYAVDAVGSDAYAITITPAITAYSAGQIFSFKAGTANTGACTLNVSGLGAKTIKKNVSEDLATGDILANQNVLVQYDGTNMQLLSASASKIDVQTFTSSGTYTKPAGTPKKVLVQLWGGGGSGGKGQSGTPGAGGGGGGYKQYMFEASAIGATETVTIGDGGVAQTSASTNGNVGSNTTFGSLLTAYGGGGGERDSASKGSGGGGGGGALSVGLVGATRVGGNGGNPSLTGSLGAGGAEIQAGKTNSSGGGGGGGGDDNLGGGAQVGGAAVEGGGGGGGGSASTTPGAGGASQFGGGGGGGGADDTAGGAGGSSVAGGAGGAGAIDAATATTGSVPSGGGGGSETGTSGAGGKGKCIVTTFY